MDSVISPTNRCLLVVAAPKEVQAVLAAFPDAPQSVPGIAKAIRLDDRFDLIRSGVGKASSAAATARALTLSSYRSAISVGIAGSLPCDSSIKIAQSIAATRSSFSDEGIGVPDGFVPISEIGFAPFADGQMGIDHDPELTNLLATISDTQGIIATVSWCSGDDGCAKGVSTRTGALAEAMEGAAVAVAAKMVDPDICTGELRVISNTTGNRANQIWNLDAALSTLTHVLGRLAR